MKINKNTIEKYGVAVKVNEITYPHPSLPHPRLKMSGTGL